MVACLLQATTAPLALSTRPSTPVPPVGCPRNFYIRTSSSSCLSRVCDRVLLSRGRLVLELSCGDGIVGDRGQLPYMSRRCTSHSLTG